MTRFGATPLLIAAEQWSRDGSPQHPVAWLVATGKSRRQSVLTSSAAPHARASRASVVKPRVCREQSARQDVAQLDVQSVNETQLLARGPGPGFRGCIG